MRINPSICFAFSGVMFALTESMASPDLTTSNTPNVPTGAICSSDRSTRRHSDVRHQIASPIQAAAVDQRHMTMTEAVPKNPRRPPICSSIAAGDTEVNFPFCRVTPTAGKPGQHDVTPARRQRAFADLPALQLAPVENGLGEIATCRWNARGRFAIKNAQGAPGRPRSRSRNSRRYPPSGPTRGRHHHAPASIIEEKKRDRFAGVQRQ
jgi:hypothetical protein